MEYVGGNGAGMESRRRKRRRDGVSSAEAAPKKASTSPDERLGVMVGDDSVEDSLQQQRQGPGDCGKLYNCSDTHHC